MMDNDGLRFGCGISLATPYGGGDPVEFGVLQEISIDIKRTSKKLKGRNKTPLAVAISDEVYTGKAKNAQFSAGLYNAIFFGETSTTGQKLFADAEAGSIPASSAYTITVANSATWESNGVVKFASTGKPLTKVESSPAAGQYSVSAGVYTFASGDAGKAVLISYFYTQASTGKNTIIRNRMAGVQPVFQLDGYTINAAVATQQYSHRWYRCVGTGLTLPFKNDDWGMDDFEFEIFSTPADTIGEFNTAI